jgi:hypothetical protein
MANNIPPNAADPGAERRRVRSATPRVARAEIVRTTK